MQKNTTAPQRRWSTTGSSLERRGECAWRSGKHTLEGRHYKNVPLNTAVVLLCVVSGGCTRIHSPKQLQETGDEPSGKAAGGGHAAAWAHSLEHPQHGRHLEAAPTHFPPPSSMASS